MVDISVASLAGEFPFDWRPIWLTLRLATVTTVWLLLLGTPLAWWLARRRTPWTAVVEALVALPLVLPPTVLGFYLLVFLGPRGPLGSIWEGLGGERLVFSFHGLVLGSLLYSLPFVIQPLQNAFESIAERSLEVASTLGASGLDRFFTIVVPLSRSGFLTACVLGFAHTVGEFGVVLMLGGNIPGRTQVISIQIYDQVEQLAFGQAHALAGGMLAFSFGVLFLVYAFRKRTRQQRA